MHAAAVVRHGKCLLLTGPSGAGKSTLSYALFRRGAQLLSEETIYISPNEGWRIYGLATGIHLPAGSEKHFPELQRNPVLTHPGGKQKMRVDPATCPSPAERCDVFSGPVILCILRRTGGNRSRIEPLGKTEYLPMLLQNREPGYHLHSEFPRIIADMPVAGIFSLDNSGDLMQTVIILESILEGDGTVRNGD